MEALIYCWWECKKISNFGKEIVTSSVKHEFNIWFVNSSLCDFSKMMKACSHKDVNVHSNINHNSPKVEPIQMPTDWWMDKHSLVYSCCGRLCSHEKEWNPDSCHNVESPHNHHAEQKKPDTKGHTVCESIYMECPEKANQWRRKGDLWSPGSEGRRGWRGTAHQDQVSFWRNENTQELDSSDGYTTGNDTKNT